MDVREVPRKTLRGYDEIQTRKHRLSPLARRILIMADGRHSLAALADELDLDSGGTAFTTAVEALLGGEFLSCADLAPERGTDPASGPRAG